MITKEEDLSKLIEYGLGGKEDLLKFTVQGRTGKKSFIEHCPKVFQALVDIACDNLNLQEQDARKKVLELLSRHLIKLKTPLPRENQGKSTQM